eukprot:COSAG01_NODE_1007_length_12161_cov_12.669624_12_plen_704_part_00
MPASLGGSLRCGRRPSLRGWYTQSNFCGARRTSDSLPATDDSTQESKLENFRATNNTSIAHMATGGNIFPEPGPDCSEHAKTAAWKKSLSALLGYAVVFYTAVLWFLILAIPCVVTGILCSLLLLSIELFTDLRWDWMSHSQAHEEVYHGNEGYPYLLLFLPVAGAATGLLYHLFDTEGLSGKGNNLVIDKINDEVDEAAKLVPSAMAPLVYFGTVTTHLCGGSVGREGTAVQMAASCMSTYLWVGQKLKKKLFNDDTPFGLKRVRDMHVAAIAAGFGGIFGTPWAGALFAAEVVQIGSMDTSNIFSCLMASMIADLSCRTCTYVLTGGEETKHTVYADIYYQFDSNCMRSLGLDAPSGNKSTIQYLTDNSTFGGYSGDRAAEFLRTVCPIQQSGETNKVVLLCQLAFAGMLFSVASVLFSEGAHKFKEFAGWITKPFSKNKVVVSAVKPFIGGTLFIGIYFLIKYLSGWDTNVADAYLGIGSNHNEHDPSMVSIESAFPQYLVSRCALSSRCPCLLPVSLFTDIYFFTQAAYPEAKPKWYDWILKLLLTTFCLGFGYKGGEVTPLFMIGSTMGYWISTLPFIDDKSGLFPAVGFVAVFGGATNTPVASAVMGIELFSNVDPFYFMWSCLFTYIFNEASSIYTTQRLNFSSKIRGSVQESVQLGQHHLPDRVQRVCNCLLSSDHAHAPAHHTIPMDDKVSDVK